MGELRQDRRIQLVASERFVRDVDEWRRAQPDLPSRSEAIRHLTELGMKALPVRAARAKKSKPKVSK